MNKQPARSSPNRSPSAAQRRLRANPRRIKRKMSGWHVKRPEHRNSPQPTLAPDDRITIIAAQVNGIATSSIFEAPCNGGTLVS